MRSLSELIVLIRGGGEVGSAIAYRLARCHFRVCLTEIASPQAISRGVSFSEAVYDTAKMVEELTAERTLPTLDNVYRIWRTGKIPIAVDPELGMKPLIRPDVLINAMMLNRETNTQITDAPLVIGIGPGFTAGSNVHMVIESNFGSNLGNIIFEGEAEKPLSDPELMNEELIMAEDAGVFITEKNIGDSVIIGEVIGSLNDIPLKAPGSGVLHGILRNESKVLANIKLVEIDPSNNNAGCFNIRDEMKIISASVLETIMISLNVPENN